jgi:hypothetical protein
MKTIHEVLLVSLLLGSAEFFWYASSHADQAGVDDGVSYAKDLLGNVQAIGGNIDVNATPGYGGINMQQADYYNNQDLNGLQTDAIVDINAGAANEASLYAYEKAQQPKLQFGPNDPILLNSGTISTDAMLNPDVLTVKTGDCNVVDVAGTETRIETCTAWMSPTTHVCNRTLNVDVTWEDISSCPIGIGFSQVQELHNTRNRDDFVYARAYCNPGVEDNSVILQLFASDGGSTDCTGWTDITVSTSQNNVTYSGALLRPKFRTTACRYVPTFIQGACVSTDCNYTITYRELNPWADIDGDDFCEGNPVDLIRLGMPEAAVPQIYRHVWQNNSSDPNNGKYCVYKTSSVNVIFEKPSITRTPTVTETWNDGCGFYEAQVQ